MSRDEALAALQAQLGAPPPPGCAQLSAPQLRDLAEALAQARRHQTEALQRAGAQAFEQIPWLLRGPIRRIMR